jgi:Domain of unknown function (DUF4440)
MKRALLASALSALTLAASAQSRLPPGVDGSRGAPGAMATRSVSHYLELERALADALHARRRDAVQQMLAPDFEVRTAEALDAVPAADWLAEQLRAAPAMRVRDLAVREFGDVAVVSFWVDAAVPGARRSPLYVIDVWQQGQGKLAARYLSQPAHALPAPARPRGRE